MVTKSLTLVSFVRVPGLMTWVCMPNMRSLSLLVQKLWPRLEFYFTTDRQINIKILRIPFRGHRHFKKLFKQDIPWKRSNNLKMSSKCTIAQSLKYSFFGCIYLFYVRGDISVLYVAANTACTRCSIGLGSLTFLCHRSLADSFNGSNHR